MLLLIMIVFYKYHSNELKGIFLKDKRYFRKIEEYIEIEFKCLYMDIVIYCVYFIDLELNYLIESYPCLIR